MRFFFLVSIVATFAGFTLAQASTNATFIAEELASISSCGLGCLEPNILAVGCGLLNTTCQCSSTKLVTLTSKCVLKNCTFLEGLELSKTTAKICERPYQSQNEKLRIMTYVCATITNGAVLVRMLVRFILGQSIGMDDVFILLSTISAALFTYFGVLFERNGFGIHIYDIDITVIPNLLYWFFICEILYLLTIGLVKISILFFYLRVFPKRSFRISCYVVMAFSALTTTSFVIAGIFQCTPIRYAWRKELKGTCTDYNIESWANAGLNILIDLIIVALPISELQKLQLSLKKKIGMYAMFGVGGFVCVCAIIRLHSLKNFGLTADPSWDNVPTTFWSTIETTSAIFCACMPAIRAGCVRIFPRVFGGSTLGSANTGSKASNWTSSSISTKKPPINHEDIMLAEIRGSKFIRISEQTFLRDESEHSQNRATFLEDDSLKKDSSSEKDLPKPPRKEAWEM